MAGLIDTSVLVAMERGRSSLEAIRAFAQDTSASVATITISELLVGVHRARDPERKRRRLNFVDSLRSRLAIVPFDLEIAEVHAEVQAALAKAGQLVGAHDLIIAATAIAHDLTLYTLDVRHFTRIAGLSITPSEER